MPGEAHSWSGPTIDRSRASCFRTASLARAADQAKGGAHRLPLGQDQRREGRGPEKGERECLDHGFSGRFAAPASDVSTPPKWAR